ncbi:MAG: glycosyl transferase [Paludibacteraceae bacterium]|nr:glycosyl transferase [Paludibacteraceae bacterium]
MIPKIIHYCWFGENPIPEHLRQYMQTWSAHMPNWEIREWNEQNYSIEKAPLYVRQAYEAKKFAFVSDYVRLLVLEKFGGVYLDTDVEVVKSLEPFLKDKVFMGLEESLAHLPGTCVMGCEPHSAWAKDMLRTYDYAEFIKPDGSYDLTTNVQRMGKVICEHGFVRSRKEQFLEEWGLRIYTHDYFSPITSTRVIRRTNNTYAIHHLESSWSDKKPSIIPKGKVYYEIVNFLIQIKRKLKGID